MLPRLSVLIMQHISSTLQHHPSNEIHCINYLCSIIILVKTHSNLLMHQYPSNLLIMQKLHTNSKPSFLLCA
ncbi:hypothetical protein JHK86_015717 [Glycine max]|nr:hypothetical protein JHK86_015717 [Glycine max]